MRKLLSRAGTAGGDAFCSMNHPPAQSDSRTASVLRLAFLTLFLDLAGFSLIFPLFPKMLEFYRLTSGDGLFGQFDAWLSGLSAATGGGSTGTLVLFGGILGSIYSLLQFLFAPIAGALSDRFGRKPLLLGCLVGMTLSYVLWFFAGRFELLLLARFIGGISSANISIVSAIVSDVTPREKRSKGMAVIGIAFGLGFVLGPAIGGVASLADLSLWFPAGAAWGLNPFSAAAGISLLLSVVNLLGVAWRMPETRPVHLNAAGSERTANPFAVLKLDAFPGVPRVSFVYLLFIYAFSGVEFTLTFMATEYFGYGPKANAAMLVAVGLTLAMVQGSYVRRRGDAVGPRRMGLRGLALMPLAVALIAACGPLHSQGVLYAAVLLAATGMALAVPSLTSLVTLYGDEDNQGRINGVFRSLGALGRALGPLGASVVYWRFGSVTAYSVCLGLLALAWIIGLGLPTPPRREAAEAAA
jgi:MFS family permease